MGERRRTEAPNPTARGDDLLCPSGFSKRSVETRINLDLFCSCAATRMCSLESKVHGNPLELFNVCHSSDGRGAESDEHE